MSEEYIKLCYNKYCQYLEQKYLRILEDVDNMRWFDKLERKFGRIAISGLMTYIVILNGFVYILNLLNPAFVYKIDLIPELVMKGEVWRLFTYIFIPMLGSSLIFIVFVLYFYYMIGSALEHEWGSFRFNLYYFIGMLGTTIAAFITGGGGTATYLNLSLFLAFARIFPDYELLIFFFLPVKVKYLAWLNWALFAWTVLTGDLSMKLAVMVSVVNYFIFFGRDIFTRTKTTREVHFNRQRFRADMPKKLSMHRCTVCGITELEDPTMDFRYCSKCEGHYEYCRDHLQNHTHKTS